LSDYGKKDHHPQLKFLSSVFFKLYNQIVI